MSLRWSRAALSALAVAVALVPGRTDDEPPQVELRVRGGDGTVRGKITYDGKSKLPDNPEVAVVRDRTFCTSKGKILHDEWIVDGKSRGIKNVIVWLSHADAAKAQKPDWPAELIHKDLQKAPEKLVIDQPVCSFVPRIIALREGTELIFENSATVPHVVKIDCGPMVNVVIAPGKSCSVGSIDARYVPALVNCAIHPWMKSWLISFRHPYFAVTNDKGEFAIRNAPSGNYRLQIWHEGYGFVQKNKNDRGILITIEDGETTTVHKELLEHD